MSSANPESKQSPDLKTLDDPEHKPPSEQAPKGESEEVAEEEEGEEGECGFCLFMKAGGCRESFVGWENCIKEAEENKEDVGEKCFKATSVLMKCMEAHADYYAPILRAEKKELEEEKERRAEEEAVKELQEEKERRAQAEAIIELEEEKENSKDLEKKSDG